MAFNPYPTGYFPGIDTAAVVGGATGVFIPYEDLESYNATVVASGSGDIRQLVYSFNEAVSDHLLNTLPVADRPSQMSITRTSSVPTDTSIRKSYTIVFTLDFPDTSVSPEQQTRVLKGDPSGVFS